MTSELDFYGDVSPEKASEIRAQEVEEFGEEAVLQANDLDLPGAVERLKRIEVLEDELDYVRQLLWCAFTYLHDLFSGKYDLAWSGPKSSGKTRLTVYSTLLAREGRFVTDTTPASLTALLDDGAVLGFDEADSLIRSHRNDLVEAILRSSAAEEAQRFLMEKVVEEVVENGEDERDGEEGGKR